MEVKIEYKTSELQNPVRITELGIQFDAIDENPLNIVSDSWRVKSNGQTINTHDHIELDKVDCPMSTLPVISSPEPSPTWGQWEEWEHCSGSCGYGTRSRFRKCIGGTDKTYDCFGEATETQSCEISCEQTQVIDETTSQAGESSDLSNQAVLNCKVFHYPIVYTFHNGKAKCSSIIQHQSSWHYPTPTYPVEVSIDLTEYWIGARLTDGKWVSDQDEEINKPIYTEGHTADGVPISELGSEICLYWKNGGTFSAPCDETKPVVCCEGSTIALNQGENYYRISYNFWISRKYFTDKRPFK